MADTSTALLPTMGSWLADRAQRAMAAAGAVAVITLSTPPLLALIVGPRLPYGLSVLAVIVVVWATAALIRVAVHGGDPRWPARAVFAVGIVGLLAIPWTAPHPEVAAWPMSFGPCAGAVVVIGWRPLSAVALGLPLSVLFGLMHVSPGGGDKPVAEGVIQAVMMYGLVLAIAAGAAALRRSTRTVATRAQGAQARRGEAEVLASAAHLRGHWTAVVHDTVLSVLASVSRLDDGPVPAQLSWDAERAVRELSTEPEAMPCRAGELASWLESLLGDLDEASFIDGVRDRRTLVEGPVAAAVLAATAEAVTNAARHSGGRVEVSVQDRDGLLIQVADDGVGFDPGAVPPTRFGLRVAIAERMELVGGRGRWRSVPGEGTVVTIIWPDPGKAAGGAP